MAFIQIIEITTTRPEEIPELVEEWSAKTEGRRAVYRSTLTADRDRPETYIQIVESPPTRKPWPTPASRRPVSSPRSWPGSAAARRCSAISAYGEPTRSPEWHEVHRGQETLRRLHPRPVDAVRAGLPGISAAMNSR